MIQKLSEGIEVLFRKQPLIIYWHNREYSVLKVGLHHSVRVGRVLHHIYSVTTCDLFFRLNLNTETLAWTLEELSDGLPD